MGVNRWLLEQKVNCPPDIDIEAFVAIGIAVDDVVGVNIDSFFLVNRVDEWWWFGSLYYASISEQVRDEQRKNLAIWVIETGQHRQSSVRYTQSRTWQLSRNDYLSHNGDGEGSVVHSEHVPVELLPYAQWVCWRYVERGEDSKPDKQPGNNPSRNRFVLKKLCVVALLVRVDRACALLLLSRLVKIEELDKSMPVDASTLAPNSMAALDHLQPQQLLADCRNVQIDRSHEQFCLELFRRAIIEKSQECWSALYEQYVKLVYSWTVEYTKASPQVGGYPIDDLVQDAFAAFWRSFTPAHFTRAAALGSVLKYLKSCAWSSVQHAVRKIGVQRVDWELNTGEVGVASAESTSPEQVVLTTLQAEQLWRAVESCCFDAREQRIARMRFVEGLKPREIVTRCPELVQTENEVHKLLRNIKDRLHRSPYVQELRKDVSV